MSKTQWTAQNRSQLLAALARKGFTRDEVRSAMQRAYDQGFAWAYSLEVARQGGLCNALITFGDTECDMWDASVHGDDEIVCHVCSTRAHAPARLTQVDGIGNACNRCMRDVENFAAVVARWDAMVAAGELDAGRTAESIASLRNLAAHLGIELPAPVEPAKVYTVAQMRDDMGPILAARYVPADVPGDLVIPAGTDMEDAVSAWRAAESAKATKAARTVRNPHTMADGTRIGTVEVTALEPGDVLRDGAEIVSVRPSETFGYLVVGVRKPGKTEVIDITCMRSNRYLVRI